MTAFVATWPWWLWGVGVACALWAIFGPSLVSRGRRRPVPGQPSRRGIPMVCPACEERVEWSDVRSMAPVRAECPSCESGLELELVGLRIYTALEMLGVFAVHVLAWSVFVESGFFLAVGVYVVGMLLVELSYYRLVTRDVVVRVSTDRACYVPVREPSSGDRVGMSRFGGPSANLENGDEPWPRCPRCGESRMEFVAQFDSEDLPPEVRWASWRELVRVFACRSQACAAREGSTLSAAVSAVAVGRPDETIEQVASPCDVVVRWAREDDWPSSYEFGDGEGLPARPLVRRETKFGGWPAWDRHRDLPGCVRCGREMRFVFQIALDDGTLGLGYRCAQGHADEWVLVDSRSPCTDS